MPILREDQALIHVVVGGVNALDALDKRISPLPISQAGWTSMAGGDLESDDVFTRPGGMQPGLNLGGPTKRTDVTVTAQYDTGWLNNTVSVQEGGSQSAVTMSVWSALEGAVGRRSMSVSYTLLDADGNPLGNPQVIRGVLKSISRPDFNANNTAAGFVTLIMACHT